jgi:O-antigen/teichoic acid export membrane protein
VVLKRIKHWIGVDRAIIFALLARSWSMLAGVGNIILISRFLSPAEQGYFYTFSSLVAIQVVFELGFSFVILQMAAHERTRLTQFDNEGIAGDSVAHTRLASILQKTVRWYMRAGLVMGTGLLFIGVYFFSSHPKPGEPVHWLLPWCLDAIAAAVAFMVDPVVCFLEGSGWVTDVARLRLPQAVFGSLLGWTCLLMHHGLFAPAMMIAGQATVALYFVLMVHGKLLIGLLRHQIGNLGISWREEIWPFQWRVAVTWASSYFIFQFFNPVLFAYTGPVVAGRMGMSLNICASLAALAQSWVNTKAPRFGSLVATNRIAKLDEEFTRVTFQSAMLLVVAEVAVLFGLALAAQEFPRVASRVVGVPTFALLLLTVLMSHFVACQSYYLRAHKEEPFLWFWVWIAIASVITVTWGGKHYGAIGVTIAYLLTGGILRLSAGTYVFLRKRREWHGPPMQVQQEVG